MVLGETEILGQLKKAYDLALQDGHTGGRLNKAFQRAFNVAKHIRTETNIQRGSVSVGSVAVELAEKIFSPLSDRDVHGHRRGRHQREDRARPVSPRRAQHPRLATARTTRPSRWPRELGGRAVPFEDWAAEFASIDIVISSTSAPHYILDRAKLEPLMKLRRNRPLLLIDIAVPRDIEPEVNFLENVYLYNIDDLQEIADDYLRQRKEEIARCEAIIREKARALLLSGPGRFAGRLQTGRRQHLIATSHASHPHRHPGKRPGPGPGQRGAGPVPQGLSRAVFRPENHQNHRRQIAVRPPRRRRRPRPARACSPRNWRPPCSNAAPIWPCIA